MRAVDDPASRGRAGGTAPRRRRRPPLVPTLLMASWVLFAIVWIWTNPLGSAPDETDHYVRAVAAGYGQLTGPPAPLQKSDPKGIPDGRRYFTLPAGMATPKQFGCNAFDPNKAAVCQNYVKAPPRDTRVQSGAGVYMPTAYILPGIVMRLASDPYSALRLGRLASALLSLSLLGVALAMLWSRARSSWALLGLLLAVTPMQIFLVSELGPNGLEVAAATCFAACAIRMVRPEGVGPWHWAGLAYGGVFLAATRPLGPVWVVGGVGLVLVLAGGTLLRRIRQLPWASAAALLLIAVAAAANLAWQARYPVTAHVDLTRLLNTYWDGVNLMPMMIDQMIGNFGWLDTSLPEPMYAAWMLAIVTVAVLAVVVGTWRERLVIGLLAVGIPLVGGGLTSYLSLSFGYPGIGQGVQGRYLLPMALWFPLVCGEVLHLHRDRLRGVDPRRLIVYVSALVAVLQFLAWYVNSRRYAVGASSHIFFLDGPLWSPATGWALWVILALAAAALIALSGVKALRARTEPPSGPEPQRAAVPQG